MSGKLGAVYPSGAMRALIASLFLLCESMASAQTAKPPAGDPFHGEFSEGVEPFRVIGNIYYVGAKNIASYLIATPEGHILIDTGTIEMVPVVRTGIEKLGFKLGDVKILLASHAHDDHVGGHAAMVRASGARTMMLGDDAVALASGTDRSPLASGDGWEPVPVDRVLKDGDTVTLGGTTLHAIWAPGHTPGCTVWTSRVQEKGKSYSIAFYGCPRPNDGARLIGNPRFPHLVDQTLRTFRRLEKMKVDIYLLMHPQEQLAGKVERIVAGEVPHPLYEPAGWAKMLAESKAEFLERVKAERKRAH